MVMSAPNTGLPSDNAPVVIECEGCFAKRALGRLTRRRVDWGAVSKEQRDACNAQVRSARARGVRPEAPETALLDAAKCCFPDNLETIGVQGS